MPVITDIKRQQKRDQLYSVFIDDKFSFSLSDLELSTSGLRISQELTASQVSDWQKQASDSKALARVYHFLSFRSRSEQEVITYLSGKRYEPEAIDRVMGRLRGAGLVDDSAFAASWIENRGNSKSKRQLEQELRQKGISRDLIEEALATVEPESETETIKALIQKKRLLERYPDRRQAMAYLGRQGFGYNLIKRALEEFGTDSD